MEDCEWDLIILRGCLQSVNVAPGDDVCPDLEAIANGSGETSEKIDRLRDEIAENVRAKRRSA